MIVKSFSDKLLLPTKRDVLKVYLYFKILNTEINASESDINVIIQLYLNEGYSSAAEQAEFFRVCLEKDLKKSEQSVRNTISKFINLGVLLKTKHCTCSVNEEFLPKTDFDKLMLKYVISHAD